MEIVRIDYEQNILVRENKKLRNIDMQVRMHFSIDEEPCEHIFFKEIKILDSVTDLLQNFIIGQNKKI